MKELNSRYKRAVVFSGGGTRYAIYGGMFAALEEEGMKPDVILSVCGGSIAAAIVNSFGSNEERKAYFQSEELFEFTRDLRLSRERMLHRIGLYCLKLIRSKKRAPYIRNIFDRYLVDMPQDVTPFLPSLGTRFGEHVPCVMIGSEVLFDKTDVEQPRGDYALYRKVLLTDERTAGMIDCKGIEVTAESYRGSAVHSSIRVETGIPVPLAMRISLSDMLYVEPVYYNGHYYAGGIIDLMPVELAKALAETLIFEKKERFTSMEEGLVRAVFGYEGNQRIAEVEKEKIDYWIDTRNVTQALKGHYVRKKIDLLPPGVGVTLPTSHRQFTEDVEMQWRYGYERTLQMIASLK